MRIPTARKPSASERVRRLSLLARAAALLLFSAGAVSAIEVQFSDDPYEFTAAERETIERIADRTEAEVRQLLPALQENIVLAVTGGAQVIDVTGEVGMALSARRVLWVVDPEDPRGVSAIAEAQLRHTLFHELHHLARGWLIEGGTIPKSILDAVVSEGMATAFARDHSGEDAPWAKYPDDVDRWVVELQNLPAEARYDHWMFAHPDGRRWIGYRAGTYLVDRAMRSSQRNSIELIGASAQEVLALSAED